MRSEILGRHLAVGRGRTFGSQFMFLVAWEKRLCSHVRKHQSLNKASTSKEAFKRQIVSVMGCALAIATLVSLGRAGCSSRLRVSPSAA